MVQGKDDLQAMDPGGLEVFEASDQTFLRVMRKKNLTIKKALTDPRMLSGIVALFFYNIQGTFLDFAIYFSYVLTDQTQKGDLYTAQKKHTCCQ